MKITSLRYLVLAATIVLMILIWWVVAHIVNNPQMIAGPGETWYELHTALF